MLPVKKLLKGLERTGTLLEDSLLSLILLAMILLASGQIIGRNLLDSSWVLGDELLRMMVLWLTLVGAVAASRADKHIAIAVLDRMLSGRLLGLAQATTHLFTATVCAMLAWYSFEFVQMSREFEDTLLGGKPAWIFQAILPIGFGIMAWRHSLHCISRLVYGPVETVPEA